VTNYEIAFRNLTTSPSVTFGARWITIRLYDCT